MNKIQVITTCQDLSCCHGHWTVVFCGLTAGEKLQYMGKTRLTNLVTADFLT